MHDLLIVRRQYFHYDIFTACYGFTPEYMHAFSHNRDDGKEDSEQTKESMRFLKKMVNPSDWANFLADLAASGGTGCNRSGGNVAFRPTAQKTPLHQWATVFLVEFPTLGGYVQRLLATRNRIARSYHSESSDAHALQSR
jgi:hypothetical protein